MERFAKLFNESDRVAARDAFNAISAWVQEHISPIVETSSGNSSSLVNQADYSKWAKSLLMYLRTKGERTDLMENALYVCCAAGDGWRTAYLSGHINGKHITEVVASIDNDAQAVQCKLACL